ncbi:MAG: hypothetical protein HQK86_10130 [Nitrospinae bacterium]|nr:hypothetical protein [Nitrospinota bacterium]MBF0633709.1 hypothetical protein [Nitrospinota bacterium]
MKIPDIIKKLVTPIACPSLLMLTFVTLFTLLVLVWTCGFLFYKIFLE